MTLINLPVALSNGRKAVVHFLGFTSDQMLPADVDTLKEKIEALRPKEPPKKKVKPKGAKNSK